MVQFRQASWIGWIGCVLFLSLLVSACGGPPLPVEGPKVEIVFPENGDKIIRDQIVNVQTVAIDDARGVSKVELWVDEQIYRVDQAEDREGVPVLTVTQPWTAGTIGGHYLKARAESVDGRVSESEPILVIVEEPPTATPTATPVPTDTATPVPPTATFTATPTSTSTPTPTPSQTPVPYPSVMFTPPLGYPGQPGFQYPGQPGQPGYQYPTQPGFQYPIPPGYPGYPGYPYQPVYPPTQPGYPGYPSYDAPPNISIQTPSEGARIGLGQDVQVRSWATDDVGLARIELLVNGSSYNTYNAAGQPATEAVQVWRPTTPGQHILEVRAYDVSLQMSAPARVNVYVGQYVPTLLPPPPGPDATPPTVYIVSPSSGRQIAIGQRLEISVSASDNSGVVALELWVDGGLAASETLPVPRQNWQWVTSWTGTVPGGHDVVARARDAGGNQGQSSAVNVIVQSVPTATGRLYFSSGQAGNLDIYSIRPDGSGLTQITRSEFDEKSPAVSRDGQMLAYERQGEIWVVPTSGVGPSRLIAKPDPFTDLTSPAWSPDRQRIAFVRDDQIWIYGYAGGTTNPLTSGAYTYASPNYSPDGSQIALNSWQGSPDSSIYVLNATDGSVVRAFTSHPGSDSMPVYSQDRSRIAFVRTGGVDTGLYVMQADGSGAVRVLGQGWAPAWSPDGTRLGYVIPSGTQAELWLANQDGTNARRVLGGISMQRIAWGP